MTDLNKAMADVAALNEKGIAVKGGKKYTQVVTRVEVFRRHFGAHYGIETTISPFGDGVLAKAIIVNENGRTIGSGHSFATQIIKEKSIEKLETTAIGRALASCGLAGGEYATQDEIETHEERYAKPITTYAKTGDISIDIFAMDKAMTDIEAQETPENALKIGRSWYTQLKQKGATQDQLDQIEDYSTNRAKFLENKEFESAMERDNK